MKLVLTGLSIALASILATGCGGSGSSDTAVTDDVPTVVDDTTAVAETPTVQQVSSLKLLDVNGAPLTGATVTVATTTAAAPSLVPALVGDDGIVNIAALANGKYQITILKDGVETTVFLDVDNDNFQTLASLVAPVQVNTDGSVQVILDAIVASVSGTVYDLSGTVLPNAQVSISGGSITNGAFASATTDENGAYQLFINVNKDLLPALLNSTMTASVDGHNPHSISGMQIMNKNNMSGVNFILQEQTVAEVAAVTDTIVYTEDFEGDNSGWTVNKLTGSNADNTWHTHASGLNIMNQAYNNGLVSLAPNDTSAAAIADPIEGTKCFWYGNAAAGDTQGNFLDVTDSNISYLLDGGSSLTDNSGELISPAIDLTSVTGPVKLSFKSWWEVESVNPNANGFDLMTVSVSTDDGATWKDLARLNPLSDPTTELVRASIPFSNTGFNSAPAWTEQESIPLIGTDGETVAGQTIRLKYTFATNDGAYNGFRGWMIDDVVVAQGEGTFPLLNEFGTFDQFGDLGSSFFVLSVLPAVYDLTNDTWTTLTAGLTTDFSVDLDYVSDVNATFTLQLRDSIDDTILVDAIDTKTGGIVAVDATLYDPTTLTDPTADLAAAGYILDPVANTVTDPVTGMVFDLMMGQIFEPTTSLTFNPDMTVFDLDMNPVDVTTIDPTIVTAVQTFGETVLLAMGLTDPTLLPAPVLNAAPALTSTRPTVQKVSEFSDAKITLAGSVATPSVTSGMVALWVVMKDTATGESIMEYPVEFYEVLVP